MRSLTLLTLPAAAAGKDAFACAVKAGALEQAQKLLDGRHADRIADALDFASSGCDAPSVSVAPLKRSSSSPSADGVVLHVAPHGDDKALGGSEAPLRTLREAQARLRQLSPASRAGARVELASGTHFLDESLVFTEADSGTADKPVTWRAGAAVVSGGKALDCQGKWTLADGVYECDVGAGLKFDSLFVGGARQVRARFPNGSPLVPKDGYAGGCKTKSSAGPGTAFENNLHVLGSDGKTVISQLASKESDTVTVTVKDTAKGRTVSNCKTKQDQYYGTRFNETYNYPFWLTSAPTSIEIPAALQDRSWKSSKGAVVKMLHPAGWGGWAFEVDSFDASSNLMTFSKGGFQEARGNNGCGDMYVENLREELDSPGEWFLDSEAGKLYFMPPTDMTEDELQKAEVVAPVLPRLLQFRGNSSHPVHDIVLEGFNITHAAPTYLDSYEAPSGGDWSIHRGGAVFVDGAERIQLRSLVFDQVDGNAVFLSNHAVDNVVEKCDFWRTGDSAVAVLGSVPLGDARQGASWPKRNRISENWIEEVGVHMKQTSCVFRSLAEATVIRGNLCYNGPRAGINFNDAFLGGDVVEGNVIFNMVRETGDHGTFNSWDRREYVFDCPEGDGACFTPSTIHVRHNMFIGPAGWNMDHDDGSSEYDDFSNVVYLGGYKYRDGVRRNMTGNLMVQAVPAFQVTGFDTNYWVDNTVVDVSASEICAPDNTAALTGTVYAVLNAPPSPPAPSPYPGWNVTYCQSCENNDVLKDMGKNYGSLVDCMSACGYEEGCAFINYAESSDHHCVLYKECSPPVTRSGCDASKHDWWSTWAKSETQQLQSEVTDDCWTKSCICDEGKQIQINETQLLQMVRETVHFSATEEEAMDDLPLLVSV